jgi:hypothetical protein
LDAGLPDSVLAAYHNPLVPTWINVVLSDGQMWIWPYGFETVDTPITANWFFSGSVVPTDVLYLLNLSFSSPFVRPGEVPW